MRRALRLEARLSLAELAEELGVTPAAISRWETGKRRPRQPAFDRYAQLLERLREEIVGEK
jgi:transcriptional regulator with XRE-family HTH domain